MMENPDAFIKHSQSKLAQDSAEREKARNFFKIAPNAQTMADIVTEFLEPYRDDVTTIEGFTSLVELAVLSWNMALIPDDDIDTILAQTPDLPEEILPLIRELYAAKQSRFPLHDRIIVSHEVTVTDDEWFLSVASMPQ